MAMGRGRADHSLAVIDCYWVDVAVVSASASAWHTTLKVKIKRSSHLMVAFLLFTRQLLRFMLPRSGIHDPDTY